MMGFYHACCVVPDLAHAMAELERGLGVRWSRPRGGQLGAWEYDIVFSRRGPPFLELIQGPPGSPWDAGAGPRCDHVGYWSDDLDRDGERLAERGLAMAFDGRPFGRSFAYHGLDGIGMRIELVDRAVQPGFVETWAPAAPAMGALDLTAPIADRDDD